jgi:hypothetical protein
VKQPSLLPQSAAEQARALCARSLEVLEPMLTKRRGDGAHLPGCAVGMWINGAPIPAGAACSRRCAEVRALVGELAAFLAGTE